MKSASIAHIGLFASSGDGEPVDRDSRIATTAALLIALATLPWAHAARAVDLSPGDILVTEREILVGRSARTNAAGIAELTRHVAGWDHIVRELQTPPGVLHFKTDCSLLDEETILATPRLAGSGCFEGYRVILTAEHEEAAANSIRFNDVALAPADFPRTAEKLTKAGYGLREIPNTEAAKLDGGMSCLSLRFTPPQ